MMLRTFLVIAVVVGLVHVAVGCGGGGGRRGGGGGGGGGGERGGSGGKEVGNWESLGWRSVKKHGERDEIHGNFQGNFVALKIEVEGADVEIWDVKIHFGNGEVHDCSVRHHFREGSWSRTIDLPGNIRHIQKVVFRYKTAERGDGNGKVRVWGKHP